LDSIYTTNIKNRCTCIGFLLPTDALRHVKGSPQNGCATKS
jgi:hypothetical protein